MLRYCNIARSSLSLRNAHLLSLVAFIIAVKFLDDVGAVNARCAIAAQVPLHELNRLEVEFLRAISWRTFVLDVRYEQLDAIVCAAFERAPHRAEMEHDLAAVMMAAVNITAPGALPAAALDKNGSYLNFALVPPAVVVPVPLTTKVRSAGQPAEVYLATMQVPASASALHQTKLSSSRRWSYPPPSVFAGAQDAAPIQLQIPKHHQTSEPSHRRHHDHHHEQQIYLSTEGLFAAAPCDLLFAHAALEGRPTQLLLRGGTSGAADGTVDVAWPPPLACQQAEKPLDRSGHHSPGPAAAALPSSHQHGRTLAGSQAPPVPASNALPLAAGPQFHPAGRACERDVCAAVVENSAAGNSQDVSPVDGALRAMMIYLPVMPPTLASVGPSPSCPDLRGEEEPAAAAIERGMTPTVRSGHEHPLPTFASAASDDVSALAAITETQLALHARSHSSLGVASSSVQR
jgi:hypothetical protein